MEFDDEKSIGHINNPSGEEPPNSDKKGQAVMLDEMARSVVEWMDGWYWTERENGGNFFHKEKLLHGNGEERRGCHANWEYFKNSLDVIREVEEALDEEGLGGKYYLNINNELITIENTEIGCQDQFKMITAGPETRLRAIYKTLKEAGELNGT